jgi:hypothetical protein
MICPCCQYKPCELDEKYQYVKPFIEISRIERSPLVPSRGYDGQCIMVGTPVKAHMCPRCGVVFGEVS